MESNPSDSQMKSFFEIFFGLNIHYLKLIELIFQMSVSTMKLILIFFSLVFLTHQIKKSNDYTVVVNPIKVYGTSTNIKALNDK